MQIPVQIAFRNMNHSESIKAIIEERAAKLERYADRILSCQVVVDVLAKHHRHGNPFQVRLDITIPGETIAVTREASEHTEAKNIHVAIRDAFDAAGRQLEDHIRLRRGLVKTHEAVPHARIIKLVPDENYGFIATPEGREIYFHKNSVIHEAFDRLELGTEVTFVEEPGQEGPQATTVKRVGRHHHL